MYTVNTISMRCLKQGEVQTVFVLTVRSVIFIDMRMGGGGGGGYQVPCVKALFIKSRMSHNVCNLTSYFTYNHTSVNILTQILLFLYILFRKRSGSSHNLVHYEILLNTFQLIIGNIIPFSIIYKISALLKLALLFPYLFLTKLASYKTRRVQVKHWKKEVILRTGSAI